MKIKVKLPDGAELELEPGATGADAAAAIGAGLAKAALAVKVDGELRDLSAPLEDGEQIEIVTDRSPEALELIRHDAAHVLAESVLDLWPNAKISIGPPIENGFYYDIEFPDGSPGEEDLARIEERMAEHVKADEPFERRELLGRRRRSRYFRDQDQDYKVELIEDLIRDEGAKTVSLYRNGPFEDLCRGPARPLDRTDRRLQADLAGGRLLARRRDPADADAHLRDRLPRPQGARAAPGAPRAGARARPSQARPAARPLRVPPRGAGDALLAAAGHGPAAADRGRGPQAARRRRLPRDQDPAGARRRALAPLGPLGQLQGEHVLHRPVRARGRGGGARSTRSSR